MMAVPAARRRSRCRPGLLALMPLLCWTIGCAALGGAGSAERTLHETVRGQSPTVEPPLFPFSQIAVPAESPSIEAPRLPPPTPLASDLSGPPPAVLPEPAPPPPPPGAAGPAPPPPPPGAAEPGPPPPPPGGVEPGPPLSFPPEARPPAGSPGTMFLTPEPAGPVPLFGVPSIESGLPVGGGCASCGGGAGGASDVHPAPPADACACGIGGCGCVPGRNPCYCCNSNSHAGRFFGALYECVCCPDPCYEPRWVPAANASFFTDPARPVSQMRIRYDSGLGLQFPDRAEYFWARADGKGRGPAPVPPHLGEGGLEYNQLNYYTEVAIKKFSFFVEVPYLSVKPDFDPYAAGFGNLNLGTKSLLHDCELFQLAFQFRTYIPIGNFRKGIGNGHVTLEPSLLLALKLAPDTYLQAQLGEWIPIAGDPNYQGSLLLSHLSVNHVLWRIMPDVPLIGTMEFNGLSFQTGSYTDPILGAFQKGGGYTFFSAGPGLRLVVCNRIDIGFGTAFAVNSPTYPRQLYRTEFRWRF